MTIKVLYSKLPLDLCLPAEKILTSIMNIFFSQIKIGFNIDVTSGKIFFTLLVHCL